MSNQKKAEFLHFAQTLKNEGANTASNLLLAVLIWLFGVLVFLPLAGSVSWETRVLSSLIILIAFTVFVFKAAPSCKRIVDAFSLLPADKYSAKWQASPKDVVAVFRYSLYLVLVFLVYALYFPLLASFHLAIAGVVLIVLLVWAFTLLARLAPILFSRILKHFG